MEILFDKDIFSSLAVHDFDTHVPRGDMHSTQLCKAIAHKYIDIRLLRHQQSKRQRHSEREARETTTAHKSNHV